MPIRGLLFDKDGTLIDVIGTWLPVYREMLAEAFPGQKDHWHRMLLESGYDPDANNFKANSPHGRGNDRSAGGSVVAGACRRRAPGDDHGGWTATSPTNR